AKLNKTIAPCHSATDFSNRSISCHNFAILKNGRCTCLRPCSRPSVDRLNRLNLRANRQQTGTICGVHIRTHEAWHLTPHPPRPAPPPTPPVREQITPPNTKTPATHRSRCCAACSPHPRFRRPPRPHAGQAHVQAR